MDPVLGLRVCSWDHNPVAAAVVADCSQQTRDPDLGLDMEVFDPGRHHLCPGCYCWQCC